MAIGGIAKEFVYDDTGRMSQVKQNAIVQRNYAYNGKGEQVRKFLGASNTYTVYDEAGHWLGDYNSTGAALQQAIWLDDLPVGLIANGNQLHYVEPDHLGTPRVVIEVARNVPVWTWDLKSEAFGNSAPNQDPDVDTTPLVFDMRFPGQRYDVATSTNQNYFRDYDPSSGRYTQSDPIGLGGGIATYVYVGGNPVVFVDDLGFSRRRGAGGTPPPTYNQISAAERVPFLVRQIQNFDTSFRYSTTAAPGYRYNRSDVRYLENILRQHQANTPNSCPNPQSTGQRHTPDQQALVQLAKEAQRNGISPSGANTLMNWANEYGLPARGIESHPGRPFGQYPHIHVGPIDHIPVGE